MKHPDLQIIFHEFTHQPQGIRDKSGYLLFFPSVTRYENQQARYERELDEMTDRAEYLLAALKERT